MPGIEKGISPFLKVLGIRDKSVPIGTIVQNNFNAADWTIVGSGITFPSSTKIVLKNGNDDFANYAYYNQYFNALQDVTFVADVKIITTASNGVAIGFLNYTLGATQGAALCQLNLTGAGARLWMSNVATGISFNANGSPNLGAYSVNDIIRITCSYTNRSTTIIGQNITTAGPIQTLTYDAGYAYPFINSFFLSNVMNRFTVWNVGADTGQEITAFSVTTSQKKNIRTLLVGDSKTSGSGATSFAGTILGQSQATNVGMVENSASPGDTTVEVISRLNEIIAYHPTNVVLWIGCNDVRYGGGAAVAIANIITINNTLAAAGITVYNCLSAPENALDLTPLNTLITVNCTNVIDLYTPLWSGVGTGLNAAYDCGDGVHLNDAGYAVCVSAINSAYSFLI